MSREENREDKKTLQTLLCCIPQGVTTDHIWSHASLPLPLSSSPLLTHSPPPSLSFPLFCNIPSLNVQPVCPSRLSEYATSRLDTLHGRHDQNGPRGDLELKRLPKQINTARDVHQKAAIVDEANRSFEGFSIDGILAAKMERGEGRAQTAERRASGMAENSTQGLALNSGSVHPVFRLPVHCHTGVQ